MKINIAYPPYRSQQLLEVDDEKKTRVFYEKRISEEVPADFLGDEFKGYVFKITGGFDKQGFAMKQGVLLNHRTRLLLDGSTTHYNPKRDGCRKRKSVRGCIIGNDLSVVNVIIVKRGPTDLPKLTDKASDRPSTRGPKRANHIRKVWGLKKTDDVRQYVVRRKVVSKKSGKEHVKSPKIQRLITPIRRHHKQRALTLKKKRYEKSVKEASDYAQLVAGLRETKRSALLSKRRELKSEKAKVGAGKAAPAKTAATTKAAPAKTAAKPAPVKTPATKTPATKKDVAPKKDVKATPAPKKDVAKKPAPVKK
jgi:small subunit ribosomal protein S6e